MWEKCTICKGTGLDPNCFIINNNTPKCPVCNGKRIINTLTGNPPVDIKINETIEIPSANDFAKLFYGTFKEDRGPR